jgi:DNA-binding transcriptional regulator YiaG
MKKDQPLSPLAAEMVAGLSAFCDAIEAGEPIEKRFTIRTVTLDLKPKDYSADDVRHVRETLGASQALLARFLGVSVSAVRAWEQGSRRVPPIACRFLDEIVAHREVWTNRIRQSTTSRRSRKVTS